MATPAQGVDAAEYNRVLKYVLVKARRYGLPKVRLSDVQTHPFSVGQIKRLHADVAAAGFKLELGHHVYGTDFQTLIAQRTTSRFGDEPKTSERR